jgi:hypothetical protein
MPDAASLTKLVPGFDFLQGLVNNAGAALPRIGQWVAPTLNPEELEKRIEELRTVQFWLEQNARLLGATIQALEVQRMTLSTLKTMNVQMDDLRESLKIRPASGAAAAPGASPPAAKPARQGPARRRANPTDAPGAAGAGNTAGAVDPMQWWGALTQQFTQLAATALKEAAAAPARNASGAAEPQQNDAAGTASKDASAQDPAPVAPKAATRTRKRAAAN